MPTGIDVEKFKNQPAEVQLSVVTHEVFHCYRQVLGLERPTRRRIPPAGYHDGEATSVQMTIVPPASFASLRNHWDEFCRDRKRTSSIASTARPAFMDMLRTPSTRAS